MLPGAAFTGSWTAQISQQYLPVNARFRYVAISPRYHPSGLTHGRSCVNDSSQQSRHSAA